ncbi:condensation domain-containing protein [Rummeliibacillus stabekisii]|uniref:condensation domain-containing protein n=1 Tax=Rummeliibacillus stabekisii TaxID=241244 RepID=UPI00203AF871|nr:condensation domain-containing protein [Rummeliibacillus stabekisii]MCM3318032.1 condensation domain-containing protein [Rummeliibacillus stabekisii]
MNQREELVKMLLVEEKKKFISPSQKRFWFINLLNNKKKNLNFNTCSIKLNGILDFNALNQSINIIFKRQDMLRASVKTVKGRPEQIIKPYKEFIINTVNLSKEDNLNSIIDDFRNNLKFEDSPLANILLIRKSENLHILLISLHHYISDGWSFQVFFNELNHFYEQYKLNKDIKQLPHLKYQYYEYAFNEQQKIKNELFAQKLSFWNNYLKNQQNLKLPLKHSNEKTLGSSVETYFFNQKERDIILNFCQKNKLTLFQFMVSIIQYAFYLKSPHLHELSIGTPVSRREGGLSNDVIGCFINTIIIRTLFLDQKISLEEFIIKNKSNITNALKNQSVPYEQIIKASREDSLNSKGYKILVFEDNTPPHKFCLGNLECEYIKINTNDLDEEMAIYYHFNKNELSLNINYKNYYEEEEVQNLMGNIIKLVRQL